MQDIQCIRTKARSTRKGILSVMILMTVGAIVLSGCGERAERSVRQIRATKSYVMNRFSENPVIEIGPILAHAGSDYFTVSCRTDHDACVRIHAAGRIVKSDAEEYHSVVVGRLQADRTYSYRVEVRELNNKQQHKIYGPYAVRTLPKGPPFSFVIYGDPQAVESVWGECSHRMLMCKPNFALALGDMVWTGADKWEWTRGLCQAGAEFFAQVPQFVIRGNHDVGGEKWFNLFATPSGTYNWTQVIGPVRLIGIDSMADWDRDDLAFQWLQGVLERARDPYVFLAMHAPPYTSTMHGETEDDRPHYDLTRTAQEVILPLAARYQVTAILSGHAHAYERNELPNGITCITSGGAGAELYGRMKHAARQNPYSKVFFKRHHFLEVRVTDKDCRMQAIDLQGRAFDSCVWQPRIRP